MYIRTHEPDSTREKFIAFIQISWVLVGVHYVYVCYIYSIGGLQRTRQLVNTPSGVDASCVFARCFSWGISFGSIEIIFRRSLNIYFENKPRKGFGFCFFVFYTKLSCQMRSLRKA